MTSINTNVQSMNAQRALAGTSNLLSTSMSRLSSGLRVNGAKDDAAGLAIAERMQAQTKGMNAAIRNANDAISLAQTAEGALSNISQNLQRMRELAVQAANGTNNSTDNSALQKEFQLLGAENERIATSTQFNGKTVIGTNTAATAISFDFQVGANNATDNRITVENTGFSMATTFNLNDATNARAALDQLDSQINNVTSARATWGASQNRFEAVVSNLRVSAESSAAARGRIMDTDYAQETANLSRAQVLQQAGTAMVAQANQGPQGVLALLR